MKVNKAKIVDSLFDEMADDATEENYHSEVRFARKWLAAIRKNAVDEVVIFNILKDVGNFLD